MMLQFFLIFLLTCNAHKVDSINTAVDHHIRQCCPPHHLRANDMEWKPPRCTRSEWDKVCISSIKKVFPYKKFIFLIQKVHTALSFSIYVYHFISFLYHFISFYARLTYIHFRSLQSFVLQLTSVCQLSCYIIKAWLVVSKI